MVEALLLRLQLIQAALGAEHAQFVIPVFCLVMVAAQVALLPVTPFAVVAGFAFGFWPGTALLVLGKMIGASVNFALSRWAGRNWADRITNRHPLFQSVNEALSEEGIKMALLLRLCPIPFSLANYAYGVTSIAFPTFLVATFLTILAPTFIFCGVGASLKAGVHSIQNGFDGQSSWQAFLLLVGFASAFFVSRAVTKRAMAKIRVR